MKLIYADQLPFDCPAFDFEAQASHSVLAAETDIAFAGDSSLTLPWRLRKMMKLAGSEKVVVHAGSARALMAAAEARRIEQGCDCHLVYSLETTVDHRELEHAQRYAAEADVVLSLSDRQLQLCSSLWTDAADLSRLKLLTPPAVAPSWGDVPTAPTLLYQGEITPGSQLVEAVKALGERPDLRLLVIGTGKGRWAMPAVKLARGMGLTDRALWDGMEHATAIRRANALVAVLSPERWRPAQQLVNASYAAQGARIITTCSTAADILSALDAALDAAPDAPTIPAFFDSLLRLYRSL